MQKTRAAMRSIRISIYIHLTASLWLAAAPSFGANKVWLPSGIESWFITTNWSPFGVPDSSSTSMIDNGGTANATSGTSNVLSERIEVGKNGGTGTLNVSGRTLTLGS